MSSTNNQIIRRIAIFGATRGTGMETLLSIINRKQNNNELVEIHVLVRNEDRMVEELQKEQVDVKALMNADSKASIKLTIFQGDALKQESVDEFFQSILKKGQLNEIVSSLGSLPDKIVWYKPLAPVQFPKGMEEICSRTMRTILNSLEKIFKNQNQIEFPTLLVVSSNGIGKSTHDCLPFLVKTTIYGKFLEAPHSDKEKMERQLHSAFGIESVDFNPNSNQTSAIFPSEKLIIVRPSLLTNGDAKNKVRSSSTTLNSAWTISRKDVAAFITGDCLQLTENNSQTPVKGGNAYVVSY